ncbi:MAG: type VI secretion protein IcmF/TssM N-terminal domain-containing protein, partial [Bdellovibrionota bacterium]
MSRFFSFFKNKTFLLCLVLLFSIFLICICFPYVMIAQFSPFENIYIRIILSLIAVGIAIFYYFKKIRITQAEPPNLPLTENAPKLQARPTENRAAPMQMQIQIEENLKILKLSRSDKNENLYNLPWYLVIGPSDSGKTSTLLNSELLVSLKDKFTRYPLDKTLPTKFCEWWFSNDAVFIDTEGSFLDPSYNNNCEYLLQAIQEARPQKPLNGVIVCYSIADLIHQDEHEYTNQAWNIKKRLLEMSSSFGVKDLPVYVVFSKLDLLTGFNEYFHNFDQNKLQQILGISFLQKNKNTAATSIDSFKQEFDLLGNSLRKLCFSLLQIERTEQKRGFILEFPEEFMSLKEKIYTFLSEIFSKNRFEDISFLRGVYFTSTGSIGMPIDPLGIESSFLYP